MKMTSITMVPWYNQTYSQSQDVHVLAALSYCGYTATTAIDFRFVSYGLVYSSSNVVLEVQFWGRAVEYRPLRSFGISKVDSVK